MPWDLTTPLITETHRQEIARFSIDLENNEISLIVIHLDGDDFEVCRKERSFAVTDTAGNVLMPADWPAEYPTGEELYAYMKTALYGRLREIPGASGDGVMT